MSLPLFGIDVGAGVGKITSTEVEVMGVDVDTGIDDVVGITLDADTDVVDVIGTDI